MWSNADCHAFFIALCSIPAVIVTVFTQIKVLRSQKRPPAHLTPLVHLTLPDLPLIPHQTLLLPIFMNNLPLLHPEKRLLLILLLILHPPLYFPLFFTFLLVIHQRVKHLVHVFGLLHQFTVQCPVFLQKSQHCLAHLFLAHWTLLKSHYTLLWKLVQPYLNPIGNHFYTLRRISLDKLRKFLHWTKLTSQL